MSLSTTVSTLNVSFFMQVLIVDAKKDNGKFELGPIDGVQSAVLIGDTSKSSWLKGIKFKL